MTQPEKTAEQAFPQLHPSQLGEGHYKLAFFREFNHTRQAQVDRAKRMTDWLINLVDLYKKRFGGKLETTSENNRALRRVIEQTLHATPEQALNKEFIFKETRPEKLFPPVHATDELVAAWKALKESPEFGHLFGKTPDVITRLTPTQREKFEKLQKELASTDAIMRHLKIPRTDAAAKRVINNMRLFRVPLHEPRRQQPSVLQRMDELLEHLSALSRTKAEIDALPDEEREQAMRLREKKLPAGFLASFVYANPELGNPLSHVYANLAKERGWPNFEKIVERLHDPLIMAESSWDNYPRHEMTVSVETFLRENAGMSQAEIDALKDEKRGSAEERRKAIHDKLEDMRLQALWNEAKLHGVRNIYDILLSIMTSMAGSRIMLRGREVNPFHGYRGLQEIFPPHMAGKVAKLEERGKHQEVLRKIRDKQELAVDESAMFNLEQALVHARENFERQAASEATEHEPRRRYEFSRPLVQIGGGADSPAHLIHDLKGLADVVGHENVGPIAQALSKVFGAGEHVQGEAGSAEAAPPTETGAQPAARLPRSQDLGFDELAT